MPSNYRTTLRVALCLLGSSPALALAYTESADVVIHAPDESYLGGPIANPDRHHEGTAVHVQPFAVGESLSVANPFTPGVTHTRESSVTFSSTPLPVLQAHSRFDSYNLGDAVGTYAYGALSYSFTVTGAANTLVPISISSLFELSTNRPDSFVNSAFGQVRLGLFAHDPSGTFGALYGSNRSFISMFCGTNFNGADCAAGAGDDSLGKYVDGVLLDSTHQNYSFDASGNNNFRSALAAFAFGLPLDASGVATVTLEMSATTAAFAGMFDPDITAAGTQSALHVADAYIDPVIRIDPVYLVSHPGTVLSVEAGLGNGELLPVPELPTQALLLTGLAGLVWRARRWSGSAPARKRRSSLKPGAGTTTTCDPTAA